MVQNARILKNRIVRVSNKVNKSIQSIQIHISPFHSGSTGSIVSHDNDSAEASSEMMHRTVQI